MNSTEKRIADEYKKYSKEWNEGFNKGESDYESGLPILLNDVDCRYKPFDWDYLAYQDGYSEGHMNAMDNDYKIKD